MKTVQSSSINVRILPVKLFRDDLDEILSKMRSICGEIELFDDKHQFENIDDIKNNFGMKIRKLSIQGKNPNIRIDFGDMFGEVYLTAFSDEAAAKVLFYELKDFLMQRRLFVSRINYRYMWNLIGAVIGLTPTVYLFKTQLTNYPVIVYFLLAMLVLTVIFIILNSIKQKGSVLYLEPRHNLDFWKVNKDKIMVAFVTAIISATVTLLLQSVVRKMLP
jgi:hypothetical protein